MLPCRRLLLAVPGLLLSAHSSAADHSETALYERDWGWADHPRADADHVIITSSSRHHHQTAAPRADADHVGSDRAAGSCAASTYLHDTQLKCTPEGNIVLHARVPSPSACCSLCTAHPGGDCVAWAWSQHDGVGSCNLKNGTACQSISHAGTTAGMLSPLPGPPPYKPPRSTPTGAHNVLFFAVDDMRPNIGAYNHTLAHTPNMDELAATGLTFHRAYVQYAYCSPSRHSFMTGRRPDTTRVWEFVDHFREKGVGADWISLPQYFKTFGFLTLGSGKLFHPTNRLENVGFPEDDWPASWSPEWPYFANQPPNDPHNCTNDVGTQQPITWCAAEVNKDESKLSDQKIRDSCISHLQIAGQQLADNQTSYTKFFIGCGFHKPHLPMIVPQEFFSLLPQPDWTLYPLAADPFAPVGMPDAAWHPPAPAMSGLLESPRFNGTVNSTLSRIYRQAYDAAISYTDYNIGRVLAEMESQGFKEETTIVVFGDHGYQLGEHDTWCKQTNFELGVKIPLIIRSPWMASSVGKTAFALVEMVDVYPTLAELSGLPPPETMGQLLNGTSLLPIFLAPDHTNVKSAAFSQFAKGGEPLPHANNWGSELPVNFSIFNKFHRNETKLMGYSIRVSDWRYTAWFEFDPVAIVPLVNHSLGRELYDHRGDTGLWTDWPGENANLVDRPEHSGLVQELHQAILNYIQLR